MKFKQMIPPIFFDILKKSRNNKKGVYNIGKYTIIVPPNFALPKFQKQFKLYDRFLPVLAKKINSSDQLIIDIGTNIGDTTIAMMQQCNNPFLCIEPSPIFLPYLEENLSKLSTEDFKRITLVKKLIGTGILSGELGHTQGGTASVKITGTTQSPTHTPLDTIISEKDNVILLKVDTDGFDFDVIRSAENLLHRSEPILFWENEISEDFQYEGFVGLYSLLSKKGYKYIYIFDNFGNLVTEEPDFETLKNINTYIYSMKKSDCTRTLYYTDILATTEKNYCLVKQAIDEYKSSWINK